MRIDTHHIPLPVNVGHGKGRVDRRLVGIRRRPSQVVEVEPCRELVLRGEGMVQAQRELVRIRDHFGRCGVRMRSECSGRQVR